MGIPSIVIKLAACQPGNESGLARVLHRNSLYSFNKTMSCLGFFLKKITWADPRANQLTQALGPVKPWLGFCFDKQKEHHVNLLFFKTNGIVIIHYVEHNLVLQGTMNLQISFCSIISMFF